MNHKTKSLYHVVEDTRQIIEQLAAGMCRHPGDLKVTATTGHRVSFAINLAAGDYVLVLGKVEVRLYGNRQCKVPRNLNALQVVARRLMEAHGQECHVNLERSDAVGRSHVDVGADWADACEQSVVLALAALFPGAEVRASVARPDSKTVQFVFAAGCGEESELEQELGNILDAAAMVRGCRAVVQLIGTKT